MDSNLLSAIISFVALIVFSLIWAFVFPYKLWPLVVLLLLIILVYYFIREFISDRKGALDDSNNILFSRNWP